MDDPRHPVGPEIDDSGNPTAVSPEDVESSASAGTTEDQAAPPSGGPAGEHHEGARRPASGREMLAQLQQMIDTLAVQATPVMRDVAAKAAELAAIAGQKAGPLAHRAAEATERVGERVAVRSKEMAADLRATQAREASQPATETPRQDGEPSPAGEAAPAGDAYPENDEAGG